MTNYNKEKFATEIDSITSSLSAVLQRKNADYGNNVDKNIDEWGLSSLAIRLDDKLSRFKNLIKEGNTRQVSDEAIEDTLLDLAGYAILGYRKIQEMNGEEMPKQAGEELAKMDVDRKPKPKSKGLASSKTKQEQNTRTNQRSFSFNE